MKHSYFNIKMLLFVTVLSCLALFTSPLNAQIGELGIYGSAPTPAGTPFTCGTPTKVNLQDYPEVVDGTDITLPLNGNKSFNFYYLENGTGFLSGGGYKVRYLNSSGANCYGNGDIVTYSPNSGNTNGVEVREFNYPGGQWGVYGIFLAKIPGGGGTTTPLTNATVSLGQSGIFLNKEKTNGNGYYSIYYSSNSPGDFLPYSPNPYDWKVSGIMAFGSTKCTYFRDDRMGDVIWVPTGDYLYYYDLGTITLTSSSPGCAP